MKQIDQLHQQENNNDQPQQKEQLFKTKQLTGTPFHILNRDEIYYLTLGNNLLTSGHETEEHLLIDLETNKWNIMCSLILILQQMKDQGKIPNNNKSL